MHLESFRALKHKQLNAEEEEGPTDLMTWRRIEASIIINFKILINFNRLSLHSNTFFQLRNQPVHTTQVYQRSINHGSGQSSHRLHLLLGEVRRGPNRQLVSELIL